MTNIFSNLKRCIIFANNCKKEIIFSIIFSTLITIISIIIPSISASIINNILIANYKTVVIIVMLGAILEIINTIFNVLASKNYLLFKNKFILNIRETVCRSLINFNINEYYKNSSGSILNKVQADSSRIVKFMNNIKSSLFGLIANVGIIIYIFFFNYYLGCYYLFAVLICFMIRYNGVKKSLYYKDKQYNVSDNNLTLLNEVMSGAKDIKTLDLKNNFVEKTNDSFEKLSYYEYKSLSYIEFTNKITTFLETAFYGIMIILSIFLIKNNMLTTSNFVVIFMYKKNVFGISSKLSSLFNNIGQFNLSCNRIFSILSYQKEEFGNVIKKDINGKIVFNNVSFSYDNKKVLKKFNLEIEPNSFVVIVGATGSGKSTILKLITKMYSVNSGELLIDDININELSEKTIKNNISLVNQNPHLFNFSIIENLNIVNSNVKDIKEVCKLVGLDEKINSLKKGYNTNIGPDGYILSGGEKQKLAIARTLLAKSKIILLDEITSNLDNESSYSIKQVLTKIKGKYTIILVTHNLDMVSCADRIILMDKGKIIADGKHNELLKNSKEYDELYNINKEGEV